MSGKSCQLVDVFLSLTTVMFLCLHIGMLLCDQVCENGKKTLEEALQKTNQLCPLCKI
jgi:hypothetical protein